jgi:hypothetical protein
MSIEDITSDEKKSWIVAEMQAIALSTENHKNFAMRLCKTELVFE